MCDAVDNMTHYVMLRDQVEAQRIDEKAVATPGLTNRNMLVQRKDPGFAPYTFKKE